MADRGTIRVTVVGATDVGQVREHNEDNLLVADLTEKERAASGEPISRDLGEKGVLLAVADGMGGAASGELASEMAVDTLHDTFVEKGITEGRVKEEELSASLEECLNVANERIFTRSQEEVEHRGMGTTMTAAFVLGDAVTIAQVGDSRAYLLRKGKLVQVTKDQSLISQLIEDGTLTEEEAEKLGGRNIILQALGVEPTVEVQSRSFEVLSGDVLVLCSDGLSGMVTDEIIQGVLIENEDIEVACARLVTTANEGGGRDNITVILARFEGPGLRPPLSPLEAEEAREGGGAPVSGFAAPEAPAEKPSLAKPAIGLAALLLLALLVYVFVFARDVDVVFEFPAPGANAVLLSEDGESIPVEMVAGEPRGRVSGLTPGRYRLVASLAHYDPLEKTIDISGRTPSIEVGLHAIPGTLNLYPGTPQVRVVIEKVNRREWEPAYRQEVEFAWAESREIEHVEAGDLRLEVSRDGYRTRYVDVTLPPEGEASAELPTLEPILGELVITGCSVPGALVKVTDDDGVSIFEGQITEAGDLRAPVRVGTHTLEIADENHEPHRDRVEIVEGQSLVLDKLNLVEKPGNILVHGPAGAIFSLWRPDQDRSVEPPVSGGVIPGGGSYTLQSQPPGDYIVEFTMKGRPKREVPVSLPANGLVEARYPE